MELRENETQRSERCAKEVKEIMKIHLKLIPTFFQASLLFPNLLTEKMNWELALLRNFRHLFQLKMPPVSYFHQVS